MPGRLATSIAVLRRVSSRALRAAIRAGLDSGSGIPAEEVFADPEIDATTGLRFHPVEILLSMLLKMAAVVALNILWSGARVVRDSLSGLMDEAAPPGAGGVAVASQATFASR